ncbi:MAG: flagellar basal body P-ring formation chaperone FlgA [Candidatus Scalinduaceae bacterium]
MKKSVFVYLAFVMFLCIYTASANQVEINIKDKVTLKEKTITISDISTITGDNVELVKKIGNIEIGRTPWPNNFRKIKVYFLKMRLKSSNIKLSDVVFNGARAVTISVEATKITGAEIAQKAKEYLLSVLPAADRENAVELERVPGDQWVPRKRDEIVLDVSLVDSNKDRGNIELIVSAGSNIAPFFKTSVVFKVRVFENVVIAKRKIGRRQRLTKENIFLAKRETTKRHGLAFFSMDDLTGRVAVRTILPNAIITENIVETSPTIQKGSVVKLFIEANNFSIVTKGLAQETGRTGEVIRVRNLNSKKVIYGKVVDPERVQIIF